MEFSSEIILKHGSFAYRLDKSYVKWPNGIKNPQVSGIQVYNDRIYVSNRSRQFPIAVFDMEGNFIRGFGKELNFGRIHGIFVVDNKELFVCDDEKNFVYKMTLNGDVLKTLGGPDKKCENGYDSLLPWPHDIYSIKRAGEPFNGPTRVIKASSGYLYITDGYANVSIHKFSSNLELIKTWGGPGDADGQFRLPHSICEDAKGRLWVADRENFKVQIFNQDGIHVKSFDHLLYPSESWGDDEYVYIIEGYGRISIYSLNLEKVAEIGYENSILCGGHSIAGDKNGNLYIGCVSAPITFNKLTRLS